MKAELSRFNPPFVVIVLTRYGYWVTPRRRIFDALILYFRRRKKAQKILLSIFHWNPKPFKIR